MREQRELQSATTVPTVVPPSDEIGSLTSVRVILRDRRSVGLYGLGSDDLSRAVVSSDVSYTKVPKLKGRSEVGSASLNITRRDGPPASLRDGLHPS
jgi:hypothetical protein